MVHKDRNLIRKLEVRLRGFSGHQSHPGEGTARNTSSDLMMASHEEAARFLNMINEAAANNARGGEGILWKF